MYIDDKRYNVITFRWANWRGRGLEPVGRKHQAIKKPSKTGAEAMYHAQGIATLKGNEDPTYAVLVEIRNEANKKVIGCGVSICSPKDQALRSKGSRMAFVEAMKNAGMREYINDVITGKCRPPVAAPKPKTPKTAKDKKAI